MLVNDEAVIDPVCGMRVGPDDRVVEYRGMRFAFCSEQCRERFRTHPGLYVGNPGAPAPRQRGEVRRRRRHLRLEAPLGEAQARAVVAHLRRLMGIEDVRVQGADVLITYDLLQVSLEDIENALGEAGARLGDAWTDRLRRGFLQFVEDWELHAMDGDGGGSGGAHCH